MARSSFVALLLCAGFGTRMGELGRRSPKALLPAAGRPVLDHLFDQMAAFDGLAGIHLVSNHRDAEAFRAWARPRRRQLTATGRFLRIWDDGAENAGERRGAVGDLDFLLRAVGVPEGALVASGDNLYLFSLAPFWKAFREGAGSLLLALEESDPGSLAASAALELDERDRVLALVDKPDRATSRWSCPALYGLRRPALESVAPYLAAGEPADGLGTFVSWLVDRQPLSALRLAGRRVHLTTAADLRRARHPSPRA